MYPGGNADLSIFRKTPGKYNFTMHALVLLLIIQSMSEDKPRRHYGVLNINHFVLLKYVFRLEKNVPLTP